LKHALERCVTAAGLVGGRALMVNAVDVNAVDAEAAAFWQRRGFLPPKDDPLVLSRPIAAIAAPLDDKEPRLSRPVIWGPSAKDLSVIKAKGPEVFPGARRRT
jgi:hypothetical protein